MEPTTEQLQERIEKLERELARLQHPNVVSARVSEMRSGANHHSQPYVAHRACDVSVSGQTFMEAAYGLGATKADAIAALLDDLEKRGYGFVRQDDDYLD